MTILDLFSLKDRVAIVTGASSGLGVTFAESLAEAGADVVLVARREDRLVQTQELVAAAGRRAICVIGDVSDPAACTHAVETAMTEFGRVDILVNNAGLATAYPATRETSEHFREVLDVNLNGTYWMAQSCGRIMQPGSSIVNVSSVLATAHGGLPQAAYASSKAGVLGLTRDLANQWTGRRGIRVNALAPGYFRSEMTDQMAPGFIDERISRVLAGRTGDPRELAASLIWLVSDAGGYVTGQTIVVDGGYSVT